MAKKKEIITKPRVKEDIMESVLKGVNEIERLLLLKSDEVDKSAIDNNKLANELKDLSIKLRNKDKDLKEREEKVKPIEDVSEYMGKATIANKEAKDKMKEAMQAQDIADKKKAENLKEHGEQKARIALEDKRILEENAGIKKGYAQLKEAEAKSESKIVSSFMKKIKS